MLPKICMAYRTLRVTMMWLRQMKPRPKRPGFGLSGNKTRVLVNHFKVSSKASVCHLYSITMSSAGELRNFGMPKNLKRSSHVHVYLQAALLPVHHLARDAAELRFLMIPFQIDLWTLAGDRQGNCSGKQHAHDS